jgi:transcriptional regulator with XRE-family HTH domain
VCYVARVQSSDPGRDAFAALLTAIQKRTGLSDQAIASAAGVSRSQVWRWVHAASVPGYEPVRRLAAYLLAERPEVAEMAAGLLPAAGYETPPSETDGRPAGWLSAEEEQRAWPFASVILARRDSLRDQGVKAPTGSQLFPHDQRSAEVWDKQRGNLGDLGTVWLIANRLAEAAAEDLRRGTGLTARSSIAVLAGVPGGT